MVSLMRYKNLKFLMGKRKEIIYNSRTKANVTKLLIDNSDRCIIFTGLQKIADSLGEASYHSKSKKDTLDNFKNEVVNKLSVVSMISMGVTINNLKDAIFNQLKSNENLAVQQAMRTMNIEGDKIATIWIVYLKNTRDEVWLNSALNGFDKSKITYLNSSDL